MLASGVACKVGSSPKGPAILTRRGMGGETLLGRGTWVAHDVSVFGHRLSVVNNARYSSATDTRTFSHHLTTMQVEARCRPSRVTGRDERRRRRSALLVSVAGHSKKAFYVYRASESSRRSSPLPLACRTARQSTTWRPSESDRHRRCEPAFGQLNRPMEPTSEPRRHHQSPMSIRLKCGQSTMPRNPPLAPTSARQRRRLEWRDPHGTPHCSGPALGPLGRPPGAPEGPEQPDEGWRPQCGLERH